MIIINLFLACGQSTEKEEPAEETGTAVVDTAQEDIEIDMSSLTGTEPAVELPAPDFTALNFDGSQRGRTDLVGAPTVIWFYPVAGTPG